MHPLLLFLGCLGFFHVSEFTLVAIISPSDLSLQSCLISLPYCLALAVGLVEYAVESSLHLWSAIHTKVATCLGLFMIVSGEVVRKVAMVTAKQNFTHKLRTRSGNTHKLITHGIYRWMRHPGYAGWMMWAVGMQVLLLNPVCIMMYSFVVWTFFKLRIEAEENYLREFFPIQYIQYAQLVPSGIPFIH